MAFRLNSRDYAILTSIAEHRVLAVGHIAVLHQRNIRAIRRRLRILQRQGFIRIESLGFSRGLGRPEGLISLCAAGVDQLQARRLLPPEVSMEQAAAQGVGSLPHLLLTNDFRVQLIRMQRSIPAVTTRFWSPLSPFLARSAGGWPFIHERTPANPTTGPAVDLTPDGVVAVAHAEAGKTLLFFLEVDMGTESLVSQSGRGRDLCQKILNYDALYRSQAGRRYEPLVGTPLRGFRLLILTDSAHRRAAICRLIRDMGAPNFILVTDRQSMEAHQVWGEIWTTGGASEDPAVSILGSRMPRLG